MYTAEIVNPKLVINGMQVVIKQSKRKEFTPYDIKMFHQEVALMEYFKNDRFIAKLVGYTELPYTIVMKDYPHGSLSSWLKLRPVTTTLLMRFLINIASGVMSMHLKGVVHNDLKPENILIDENENGEICCVITDFGICRVITNDILKVQQFELVNVRAWSLAYAAPERLASRSSSVHNESRETIFSWDVYSLGIIVFQMLTRKTSVFMKRK